MRIAGVIGSGRMAEVVMAREPEAEAIITNSLALALVLKKRAGPSVILTPGERTSRGLIVGPLCVEFLSQLWVDTLYFDAHDGAVHAGSSGESALEAEVLRAFAQRAGHVIGVAGTIDRVTSPFEWLELVAAGA